MRPAKEFSAAREHFGETNTLELSFPRLIFAMQYKKHRLLAKLLSAHVFGVEGLGFDSQTCQIGTVSPTVCHRCDVSS